MKEVVMEIDLPFRRFGGETKIREMYYVPKKPWFGLMVHTDKISAFDVVMKNGVPNKGLVLNGILAWWFRTTRKICPNHFITDDFNEICAYVGEKAAQELISRRAELEGRISLITIATRVFPVECIVRGYLFGSAWEIYQETGKVCGIELPKGLKEGDKLESPIFTPSTKAGAGKHDENITFEEMIDIVGGEIARILRAYSTSLFCYASNTLALKGITLIDTKFEFGDTSCCFPAGISDVLLVDEIFTPDSSRFDPPLSKQPVRDYLKSINFDKKTPIELPPEVVKRTSRDYAKIYQIVTGKEL